MYRPSPRPLGISERSGVACRHRSVSRDRLAYRDLVTDRQHGAPIYDAVRMQHVISQFRRVGDETPPSKYYLNPCARFQIFVMGDRGLGCTARPPLFTNKRTSNLDRRGTETRGGLFITKTFAFNWTGRPPPTQEVWLTPPPPPLLCPRDTRRMLFSSPSRRR